MPPTPQDAVFSNIVPAMTTEGEELAQALVAMGFISTDHAPAQSRAEPDSPPYYQPAPSYEAVEDPITLASYLFKYGFVFPLFWLVGAFIIISDLHHESTSSSSYLESQPPSPTAPKDIYELQLKREEMALLRLAELKWAWRLPYSGVQTLLELIFITHPELPSLKKAEYKRLLDDNSDLPAILEKAYEAKSFKGVMEHAAISALINSANGQEQGVAQLPASDSYGSLVGSFRVGYRGGSAQSLRNTTNYYTQESKDVADTKLYNRSMPILQSSGTGKSRTVDELADSAFTIPANIRARLGDNAKAYPPPDHSLREYLEDPLIGKSDAYEQARHAAVVMTACNAATAGVETEFKDQGLEGSELASAWAHHFKIGETDNEVGPNRMEFYKGVVEKANEYISGLSKRSTDPSGFPTKKELDAIFGDLRGSVVKMVSCVAPEHSGTTNACYFYFDEAHALTKPPAPKGPRSRSSYRNLGKVLSQIRDLPIFFFFLSTNSNLQRFAPVTSDYTSLRDLDGSYLIPPFVELPFDVFLPDKCEALKRFNQAWSLANVCTSGVMSAMGRPLWHTHYHRWFQNQPKLYQKTKIVDDIMKFAVDKLTAGAPERAPESELAAPSVRIGISFDSTTLAREAESRQVEAHMRIIYAVPVHREFMRTGYSSEPILAEAAAVYLDGTNHKAGIAISGPRILADNIQKGFLAKGERGELCGRLITTIAHDLATRECLDIDMTSPLAQGPQPEFHRPVPVLTFLRALFAPLHHDTILQASPVTGEDDKDSTLQSVFNDAFVCFSHFALADDSEMLEARCLQTALFRGMAMQAKDNQVSIDAVIPIHMGSTTNPITEKTTSAINLQFKNRTNTRPCSVDRGITVPNLKQPVISIVFELGEESPSAALVEPHHATARVTRGEVSGSNADPDRTHYSFVARGCTSKTYNAIPEEAENDYKIILAANGLKDDFPRADIPESWALVRQLKPFFDSETAMAGWKGQKFGTSSGPSAPSAKGVMSSGSEANMPDNQSRVTRSRASHGLTKLSTSAQMEDEEPGQKGKGSRTRGQTRKSRGSVGEDSSKKKPRR
ncbi:PH and SEC7 domain-containing protein 1 [Rhizoctonia solani]|uniref:PH and SEC7 domain-containing protein 1 n=1 Tax=Rhizoctonia solani TaxID=456999 RepID=A0A0K6FZM6_9AGAM|nr:PH and SEC7 domain-containing protein 1 [Rhizoctonia solani]